MAFATLGAGPETLVLVPDAWSHLDDVTARAAVVVGAGSDLPRVWFDDQAARMGAGVTSLSGGHFMLQTDPDEVVRSIHE